MSVHDRADNEFLAINDGEDQWLDSFALLTLDIHCYGCKHFREGETCSPYPEGIPNDILTGARKHRHVQFDQKGTLMWERDLQIELTKQQHLRGINVFK